MRDHAAPLVLRHAQPTDLPGIAELLLRLSDRSRYLRYLEPLAHRLGLTAIHADLLPENRASLRLLRQLGAPYTLSFDGGLLHTVLQLQHSAAAG
jgi:hypothetical protein